MLSAPDVIRSWIDSKLDDFSKSGWSVEIRLPEDGIGLNKAGFVIERDGKSVGVTLWGTGMLEIISYDDLTDAVSSSDVELSSELEVVDKLNGLLLGNKGL